MRELREKYISGASDANTACPVELSLRSFSDPISAYLNRHFGSFVILPRACWKSVCLFTYSVVAQAGLDALLVRCSHICKRKHTKES